MNDFVDARSPAEVEHVLARALAVLGLDAVLAQLTAVPGLAVQPGRPAGLLRGEQPAVVGFGDEQLLVGRSRSASLHHVVGGVRLSSSPVEPARVPGVLSAMVVRAVTAHGTDDQVTVVLTALRDALDAAQA